MDFINQFPYSDFHELNIDWLIKETKDLITRMKNLEDEFAQIEVMTEDQIREMITTAIANNNIQIYKAISDLHILINQETAASIQQAVINLTTYIDNQDVHYDTLAQGYAATALSSANAYTDNKVLNYTMMINPITGQYDDVRNVVDDIVSYFHTENSLTAGEYDALDLTADDYDAYQLTAYDYDFNGKLRLP